MAKEADAHSAEDKAQRESIEAKNQLDSMVYNIEKMLREQWRQDLRLGARRRGERGGRRQEGAGVERQGADGQGARDADPGFAQAGRADVQGGAAERPGRRRCWSDAGRGRGRRGGNGEGQKKDEGVIDAEYVDVEDKK